WTLRGGLFQGTAGDPAHPTAFATVKLGERGGVLAVLQADRQLGRDAQVSVGAWRYSARLPGLDRTGLRRDQGLYGLVEGPVPGASPWTGWVRLGKAAPGAQLISAYA